MLHWTKNSESYLDWVSLAIVTLVLMIDGSDMGCKPQILIHQIIGWYLVVLDCNLETLKISTFPILRNPILPALFSFIFFGKSNIVSFSWYFDMQKVSLSKYRFSSSFSWSPPRLLLFYYDYYYYVICADLVLWCRNIWTVVKYTVVLVANFRKLIMTNYESNRKRHYCH